MSDTNGNGNGKWGHIPNVSPTTAKLVEKMKDGKIGDIKTNETLREISGVDCSTKGRGRHNLYGAIQICERDHGVVWRPQARADAIKCLDPSEVAEVANGYRRHIGRVSRRAVRVLNTINPNQLPEGERPSAHATLAQLGAITMFAGGDMQKKLVARNVSQPPELGKLLESFPK